MQNEEKKENGIKWDFSLNEGYFNNFTGLSPEAYSEIQCMIDRFIRKGLIIAS